MYPKNAASPPRIAIGAVIQISDGAVQSSGVSVVVRAEGGSETAGGGTTSYGASSNVVYYAPTQAETNYSAFVVTAYKTGCIPVSQTIITSASATSGKVVLSGETHTSAVIPTVTTLTGHTAQTGDSYARLGAPAGASISADIAAAKTDTAAIKVKTDYLPSATAGATGGLFIAGTNAATTVTTSLTTTFTGNLTGSVASVTGAVGSVTGNVGGNVTGSVGSLVGHTVQTGDCYARLGAPAGASISADIAAAKSDTAAILTDTGTTLPAQISALNDVSVADILTTQMTEAYAADGTAPTLAQALFLIQQSIGDFSISGTTLTVKKLDGSTTAATYTLNDGTSPTSRTRAS